MSQHYSDPRRESDPYALPDVEVFYSPYILCPDCGDHDVSGTGGPCPECNGPRRDLPDGEGWFFWYCFPGCLPDSLPFGPYATENLAIEELRERG